MKQLPRLGPALRHGNAEAAAHRTVPLPLLTAAGALFPVAACSSLLLKHVPQRVGRNTFGVKARHAACGAVVDMVSRLKPARQRVNPWPQAGDWVLSSP